MGGMTAEVAPVRRRNEPVSTVARRIRPFLLASVALCGGFAATPLHAQTCVSRTDTGGLRIETCSGDLSGGLTRLTNTVDRLNISGVDGTARSRNPAQPTFGVRGGGPKLLFVNGTARAVIASGASPALANPCRVTCTILDSCMPIGHIMSQRPHSVHES